MSSLSENQVALQLQDLPEWQLDGNSLKKRYQFADFASVMSFMMHVAFYAEQLEHYPVWENDYVCLNVRIGVAEQGAVQSRDVQLARRMEMVYARFAQV